MMEMTFQLADEVIHQLQQLPNPDRFVGEVIQHALQEKAFRRLSTLSPPSKWAKLVTRINEHPSGLNGYSSQLQRDMQEFRENLNIAQDA